MRRILSTCIILVLFTLTPFAQKTKSWMDWSQKDADKMLNDSAWGQTQAVGGGPAVVGTTVMATSSAPSADVVRAVEEELNRNVKSSMPVNYRVRFLTAKPVREALARLMLLSQENPSKESLEQLQAFIDRDFGDYVIIAVDIKRKGFNDLVQNTFKEATLDLLKENTYLERKDGKRVSLIDYRVPAKEDGIGVNFVFPRTVDGKPLLSAENANVRFVCEFNKLKINRSFKISEMMYDGKIEY